jgi:iron complex outermembrane receptor protein
MSQLHAPNLPLALLMTAAAAVGYSGPGRAADAAPTTTQAQQQYDIPPSRLDLALKLFASQAGVMLSVDATLTEGKTSTGLRGGYTVDQGFAALLAGSGLVAVESTAGGFLVRAQPQTREAATTLPKVSVKAEEPEPFAPPTEASLGPLGKRSIKDTPFSLGVLSAAVIEEQQARSMLDLVRNDASMMGDKSFTYVQLFIRGFWTHSQAGNYRIDGQPIIGNGNNMGLEALDRVEVLRGLSGFMYGFASPGGAVNYVLKRPTDEPLVKATFGASSDSMLYAAGDVSMRFGTDDAFGVRVNVAVEDGEQIVEDTELSRYLGAVTFEWRIAAGSLLSLDYYRQRNEFAGENGRLQLPADVPVPDAPDAGKLYGQPWTAYQPRDESYGIRFQQQLGASSSVRLAWNRFESDFGYERLFSTLAPGGTYTTQFTRDPGRFGRTDSGQALLETSFRSGPIEHRVTAGVDYMRFSDLIGDLFAFPVTLGPSSFANPIYYPEPAAPTLRPLYSFSRSIQRDLYVSDALRFGEQWELIAGLRRSELQVSGNPTQIGKNYEVVYDETATTPSVGLIYKPAPSLSLYTSYVEALEQGGTAPVETVNAGEILPPLTSDQWEFGAKWVPDERLSVTGALFRINKGLEFTDNTINRYVQSGEQVHEGLELSVLGALAPRVNVIASYTWLDAKAKETGTAALNGKRATNVPEHQANLFVDYGLPRLPAFSLNAGLYFSDKRAVDALNTQFIPSWTRFDTGLRYEGSVFENPMKVRFAVENVFDKDYWESAPFSALSLSSPRTFKLTAEMTFQ